MNGSGNATASFIHSNKCPSLFRRINAERNVAEATFDVMWVLGAEGAKVKGIYCHLIPWGSKRGSCVLGGRSSPRFCALRAVIQSIICALSDPQFLRPGWATQSEFPHPKGE